MSEKTDKIIQLIPAVGWKVIYKMPLPESSAWREGIKKLAAWALFERVDGTRYVDGLMVNRDGVSPVTGQFASFEYEYEG